MEVSMRVRLAACSLSNDGGQHEGAAGGLLALELSAVFDMVALGQHYLCVHDVLYVIDYAAQVASAGIGRDDDLTLHVLAVDGVGTHGGLHVSHVGEGYLAAVGIVYHQVADAFHVAAVVLRGTDHEVEGLAFLVDLRYGLAGHIDCDELGEGRQGDTVAGEHVAFGSDLELGTLDLLLYVEVGYALYSAYRALDAVAYDEHLVEVVSEKLDGDAGLGTAEHGVDTVADRLTYLDVGSAYGRELLTHLVQQFRVGAVFQYEGSLYLGYIDTQCVLVQLGASGLAGHGLDLCVRYGRIPPGRCRAGS